MAGVHQPESPSPDGAEAVAWVRRVNGRWIVHEAMRGCAAGYLDHLEQTDPERLRRSCRIARHLAESQGVAEDPKPWFYAGLFSLATPDEARLYLADHAFTRSAIPALAETMPNVLSRETVSGETWAKIGRIRAAVAEITAESGK